MTTDAPTVEELYRRWLQLRDEYYVLISPDPDMLAETKEAEYLRERMGRAWDEYYDTRYPDEFLCATHPRERR